MVIYCLAKHCLCFLYFYFLCSFMLINKIFYDLPSRHAMTKKLFTKRFFITLSNQLTLYVNTNYVLVMKNTAFYISMFINMLLYACHPCVCFAFYASCLVILSLLFLKIGYG